METVIQDHVHVEKGPSRWARFTAAPVILQAYVVFAIGATVLAMSAFIPPLSRVIYPFTGGGLMLYAFTLFFAISASFMSQRKLVYAFSPLLALFAVFGVIGLLRHLNASDVVRQGFNNPHLTYHAFRPVFTITLPTAWLLLLLSPAVRRWIKSPPADGPEPRRHQLSLTDLLYATLVVSVSLAMSVALVGIVKQRDQGLAAPGSPTPTVSKAPGQAALTK